MAANLLGTSWKPRVAGILTLVLPTGLWFALTRWLKLSESSSTEISAALLGILASYGLYNSKQVNVSNSPTPLAVAQPIVVDPAVVKAVPIPLAQPVVTETPVIPPCDGPHLI